jgi:Metallopeptidase family M24
MRFWRFVAPAVLLFLADKPLIGQYLDGTTDVTRTLHFGTPTADERRALTRVLQGHIAIDTAVFPNGTSGRSLVPDGMVKALTK